MDLEDVFASSHARDPEATVSIRQDDPVRPRNPDLRLHQDRRVDADNRARHRPRFLRGHIHGKEERESHSARVRHEAPHTGS